MNKHGKLIKLNINEKNNACPEAQPNSIMKAMCYLISSSLTMHVSEPHMLSIFYFDPE